MKKFELLSIRCKMCDWKSEFTTRVKKDKLICEKCGSKDFEINKKTLQMLKKGGKFITDIGFLSDNISNISYDEGIMDDYEEPLLVVKRDNVNISENLTNEELKILLSDMNQIRNRILDKIELNREDLFNKLYSK